MELENTKKRMNDIEKSREEKDKDIDKKTRIAIIGIIIEEPDSVERMNHILHEAGDYIVGRMGIPHVHGDLNVISVVVDAPEEQINAFAASS